MHAHTSSLFAAGRFTLLLAVVATGATTLTTRQARACGGGVSFEDAEVGLDAQIAIYALKEATTELVVLVNVPTGDRDFGVVLPVPAGTTLSSTPVDAAGIALLERETRPEVVISEAMGGEPSSFSCARGSADNGYEAGSGEGEGGVAVSAPVDIGPLTAVIITGENGNAIADWLQANGFAVSADSQAIIDGYTNAGAQLVALKRNATALRAPASLGIHMTIPGDHRGFALRMASIGSAEELAITIFVAHPTESIGPSMPFFTQGLMNLDERTVADDGYRAAVRALVAENDGRVFVAEHVESHDSYESYGLAGIIDDGAVLTRLTTVVSRAELTEDVAFGDEISVPANGLYISRESLDASASPFAPLWRAMRGLVDGIPLAALFMLLAFRMIRARSESAPVTGFVRRGPAVRASRWASRAPRHCRDARAKFRLARGVCSESGARHGRPRSHQRPSTQARSRTVRSRPWCRHGASARR
jgi:hypothetical protein